MNYKLRVTLQQYQKMPRHRAAGEVSGNAFTLLWSPEMMLAFLRVLEEQDNLGKRSDTGWKPEA